MELCETNKRVIPKSGEELIIERRWPGKILPGAIQHVKMRNNLWNCVDYCFGVCGEADSVNRPEACCCWNCWCLIIWVYRVSCWPAIVVKDRFYGIDLYTEDRSVLTRKMVLVGNPMTPYDVNRVYTKMNENSKGGINNVMLRNNDPVDRRYLQRCADNGLCSSTHASVRGKPIREEGRFGYMDTPVRDADWSVEYSVGTSPVGDIRIGYLRDPVDRGQSPDAAPLTKLLLCYTLRLLRNYCVAEYITWWTFCDMVCNPLCGEGLLLRRGAFQACQAMEGAVLVDNCSSVTIDASLGIPWDAPRVVVDGTSAMAFQLVPRPHSTLDGDEVINDRRILPDGDRRLVRFRRPEFHGANSESCDVASLVKGEAGETPTSELTKDILPGEPMWGTAVQSPGYTVPEEATVRDIWAPDCTPALPAPALRMRSQSRLTTWPLLDQHQSRNAPPVVGAVLTKDIDTAAGALLHDSDMKNSMRITEWSRLLGEPPQE